MRAAINCALANRQILTHLVREVFAELLPAARLPLLYDVSHNTCKVEQHRVDGRQRELYVHRKGATRAFGPGPPGAAAGAAAGRPAGADRRLDGHRFLCAGGQRRLRGAGLLVGLPRRRARHEPAPGAEDLAGPRRVDELARRGILVRSPSLRGIAEEAPGAYKDVAAVVDATERPAWRARWRAWSR